jgi:hypothetical protein
MLITNAYPHLGIIYHIYDLFGHTFYKILVILLLDIE